MNIIIKFIEYSLEYILVKLTFTLAYLEIFLFECRSLLSFTQRGTGNKKVRFSVKKLKTIEFFEIT